MDVRKLLQMLVRYQGGESRVWSVVRVPTVADEDGRQVHRELTTVKRDRARVTNRIKGLLANQGVVGPVAGAFPTWLAAVRLWDGAPLSPTLRARLEREWEKVVLLTDQIRTLVALQRRQLRTATEPAMDQVRQLLHLRGLGPVAAFLGHMPPIDPPKLTSVPLLAVAGGRFVAAEIPTGSQHRYRYAIASKEAADHLAGLLRSSAPAEAGRHPPRAWGTWVGRL